MIDEFSGYYFFLSNFAHSEIIWNGKRYPTVEHAYQAAKTLDKTEHEKIRKASNPGVAKRLGRKVTLRKDWEGVKDQVMLELLRIKFQDDFMAQKLLDTEDQKLVEGNTWNDTYWGVCKGKGLNKLGQLLMKVREEIKEDSEKVVIDDETSTTSTT